MRGAVCCGNAIMYGGPGYCREPSHVVCMRGVTSYSCGGGISSRPASRSLSPSADGSFHLLRRGQHLPRQRANRVERTQLVRLRGAAAGALFPWSLWSELIVPSGAMACICGPNSPTEASTFKVEAKRAHCLQPLIPKVPDTPRGTLGAERADGHGRAVPGAHRAEPGRRQHRAPHQAAGLQRRAHAVQHGRPHHHPAARLPLGKLPEHQGLHPAQVGHRTRLEAAQGCVQRALSIVPSAGSAGPAERPCSVPVPCGVPAVPVP